MAKQLRHTDLYEDAILQKSVALMRKIGDAMLKEHKKTIAEIKKGWQDIGSGISGKGVRANQDYAETLKKIQSEQYKLNEIQKQRIALEKQLVKQQALSNKENRKLHGEIRKVKDVNKEANKEIDKQNGILKKQGGLFGSLVNSVKGYVAAWLGIQTVVRALKDIISTTTELDSISFALRAVIDSEEELASTESFLVSISRDYGVELVKLSRSYSRFRAAVKTTNLTLTQTRNIFDTIVKASATLGLSSERVELALLAIEQMASKGTVSMEELRRQLGDNIPGATQIMADALNVSTDQLFKMIKANEVLAEDALPKFAEELKKAYGLDTIDRIDTLASSFGRLKTEWQLFIKSLEQSDTIKGAVESLSIVVSLLGKGASEEFKASILDVSEEASKLFEETNKYLEDYYGKQESSISILEKQNDYYTERIKKLESIKLIVDEIREVDGDIVVGTKGISDALSELEELGFKFDKSFGSALRVFFGSGEEKRQAQEFVETQLKYYRELLLITNEQFGAEEKITEAHRNKAGIIKSLQADVKQLQEDRALLTRDELDNTDKLVEITAQIEYKQYQINQLTKNGINYSQLINNLQGEYNSKKEQAYAIQLKINNLIARGVDPENVFIRKWTDEAATLNTEMKELQDYIKFLREEMLTKTPSGQVAVWEKQIKDLNKQLKNTWSEEEANRIVDQIEKVQNKIEDFTESSKDKTQEVIDILKENIDSMEYLAKEGIKTIDLMVENTMYAVDQLDARLEQSTEGLSKQILEQEDALRQRQSELLAPFVDNGEYESYLSALDDLRAKDQISESDYLQSRVMLWVEFNQDLVQEIENASQAVTDLFGNILEGEIELAQQEFDIHDERLSDLESTIDKEYDLMLEGQNSRYDLLVSEKQREEALRAEALENLKRLRKQEAAIELAQQVGSLVTASANIFAGTAKDPVTTLIAIGTIASMLAAFAGYKAQIKAIEAEENYATGVIDYKGKGTETSDSNPVNISKRESIITAKGTKNAPEALKMINEGTLTDSDIFNTYSLNMPNIIGVSENHYTRELISVTKDHKKATEELNRFMKYENAKIVNLGNGELLIKQGRKTQVAKLKS